MCLYASYWQYRQIGSVQGRIVIIVDDMIDTGRRVTSAAALLKSHGAAKIYGAYTQDTDTQSLGDTMRHIAQTLA